MSKAQVGSKSLTFVPHDCNREDTMDVPFRIKGHKLRWVAARASEDRFTRPWVILRKSELPQDVIDQLKSKSMNVFRDGETVRHGENVLAYATEEAVARMKAEVERETQSLRSSIGVDSSKRPGVVHSKLETSVERVGAADFTS
jgi:hypothetical protein